MKLLLLIAMAAPLWAQSSLHGAVTDPSGAAVPNAAVQLSGPGGDKRAKTATSGDYSFARLAPGKYALRVTVKGFAVAQSGLTVDGATVFDVRLAIAAVPQTAAVDGQTGRVTAEPENNGGAVVMRARQIAALSDDPDELALELQALAGPAPGPNGGQMYVDGFSGASLPQKSSIREVRINSNPYSPENDRPGFARVDIFTKAGSDTFHGQAMTQQNSNALDTRNPLLTQTAPYRSQLYALNASGPLWKNKASFTLDLQFRKIDDHAFILATLLGVSLNETLPAPQSRTIQNSTVEFSPDALMPSPQW